jgi:hypothetical protein
MVVVAVVVVAVGGGVRRLLVVCRSDEEAMRSPPSSPDLRAYPETPDSVPRLRLSQKSAGDPAHVHTYRC